MKLSPALRLAVAERADHRCEYCLTTEADSLFRFEVDHVISVQHGGSSDAENLAYSCSICNKLKGPNVGSITTSGAFVRFYNPRLDKWTAHFRIVRGVFEPLTDIGAVTARVLKLNADDRVRERMLFHASGRIPRS